MQKILNKLNTLLYENKLDIDFSFIYLTDENIEVIELEERKYFGYTIAILRSDDPFDDELLDLYERNILTLQEAYYEQAIQNFVKIFNQLNKLKAIIVFKA